MRHKEYIGRIVTCERCQKKFEKKSRLAKLCDSCWNASQKNRIWKKPNENKICCICKKNDYEDKIILTSCNLIKDKINKLILNKYDRHVKYTICLDCFNKKIEPLLK